MNYIHMWEYATGYCRNPGCQAFGSAHHIKWAKNPDNPFTILTDKHSYCPTCFQQLGTLTDYIRAGGTDAYTLPTKELVCHNQDCEDAGEARSVQYEPELIGTMLAKELGMHNGRCTTCGKMLMLKEDYDKHVARSASE